MQKEINIDYIFWKRLKAGETQAFHELYMQYADILFSFGMVYSKDPEFVKDCIHDLFFELYKYRKNLADNDHIRNYLFKSLRRKIQSSKGRKLSLVYTNKIEEKETQKTAVTIEDEIEEQEENLERIKQTIRKLSDKQQEVLNLRFQVNLPYPEIAKILDISVESVRTLVYRTVKTIREELQEGKKNLILFYGIIRKRKLN